MQTGAELALAREGRVKGTAQAQELPGQELFQYVDDEGRRQTVSSEDVNAYLREIAGAEFSAKDFRTWAGTVLAVRELCAAGACRNETEGKKIVADCVKSVAAQRPSSAVETSAPPLAIGGSTKTSAKYWRDREPP